MYILHLHYKRFIWSTCFNMKLMKVTYKKVNVLNSMTRKFSYYYSVKFWKAATIMLLKVSINKLSHRVRSQVKINCQQNHKTQCSYELFFSINLQYTMKYKTYKPVSVGIISDNSSSVHCLTVFKSQPSVNANIKNNAQGVTFLKKTGRGKGIFFKSLCGTHNYMQHRSGVLITTSFSDYSRGSDSQFTSRSLFNTEWVYF